MESFTNVEKPEQREKTYPCPCCGFKTLYWRGNYEICPVCYWEDDGQDEHDANEVRGGPNGQLSLSSARENFSQLGAVEKRFVGNVRPPMEEERN
jgi:hypothetical protein